MAKNNKGGRPSEFKKEYIKKLKDYFKVDATFLKEIKTTGKNEFTKSDRKEFASNLPTVQEFCYKIGINRDTFYNWLEQAKNDEYIRKDKKDKIAFSDTYKICKENQESIWIQNGLKGLYNPGFAIFIGKNVFGYKDKTEQEVTGKFSLLDLYKGNENE